MARVNQIGWELLGILLVAVLTIGVGTGAALADQAEVRVDVVINGTWFEGGGLVYGDRTYVHLEDVAAALGGRHLYDSEYNLSFVLTGNYRQLVIDTLEARNPAVGGYFPIAGYRPGVGIHYGLPGPHITLSLIPSGLVTAFGLILSDGSAHEPWFDQARGSMQRFLQGDGYSQFLHVVDPSLLTLGQPHRVVFNGSGLRIAPDAFYWEDDAVYVRLRDVAEATGGGVGWDVAHRVATAKILPGDELTWAAVENFNRRIIRYYQPVEPLQSGEMNRFSPVGRGIGVGVDRAGNITSVSAFFPEESTSWFPWYDQLYGAAPTLPGVGNAYTQHIYLTPLR